MVIGNFLKVIESVESLVKAIDLIHNKKKKRTKKIWSHIMRKPTFCICKNKGADQLRGNQEVDQHLCFRHTDRTIPRLSKSKNFQLLAIFCACTAQFVSDLFVNLNVGFLMMLLLYYCR